ncbi:MAG TPA: hypothetical protein VHZ09_18490 [Acidobacteriaceae bacterium]|jgi:hypothetical protein|nr:hypothetical protein [Acidobacteriaceae bacterium]
MLSAPPTPVADPAALARSIEAFLADHPSAAILEDGRLIFDLRLAQWSVTADRGRCLLHLWSPERNVVRTISAAQPRHATLRLETRRFGQSKPQTLTLVPDPDLRTPTARDTARRRYLRNLEQSLAAHFPGWVPDSFRSAMDLEHSFGPAYARGILTKGQSAWAIIGVGPDEPPSAIEGALTLGILWLDYCRQHSNGRRVFHGLRVIVPSGCATVIRARMAWMNTALAQWELYELHPSSAELSACEVADDGNLAIQLPHAFDPQAALERAALGVDHLRALLPPGLLATTEIRPRGATEIAFTLHGLEYARVRHTFLPGSFARQNEISFGAGPSETLLDETTQDLFLDLMDRLFRGRHPTGSANDPLFRLQPERWLESVLRRDLSIIDPAFGSGPVYSQIPAFASANRTLLDLLTVTRNGRLAILELKADDDLHLPLQALDYWTRVRTLHRAGDIARLGYFPGVQLSPEDPLLCLVAPALHIHPANETVLRHFAPTVPWELIAVDEHWRQNCRVILRKRSA